MEQNHSTPLTKYKFLTSVMSTEGAAWLKMSGRTQSRLEVSIKNSNSYAHSIEWVLTWLKKRRFSRG
jgi:hypothetical protein